jgi:CSLREA domain-containing protein
MTSLMYDQTRLRRALLGLGLALLLGGAAWTVLAAGGVESRPADLVYTVTSTEDAAGTCDSSGAIRRCTTLRAAITAANADPYTDTIDFDLSLPATINLNEPLTISRDVSIKRIKAPALDGGKHRHYHLRDCKVPRSPYWVEMSNLLHSGRL